MSEHRDDYLWSGAGEPDPDVAELERLLGRFAHDGRPLGRRRRVRPILLAAAALVIAVGAIVWTTSARPDALALVAGDVRLAENEWFTATESARALALGRIGNLELEPGSRLQVRRVAADETRLYLEQGALHAFVAADAPARFFQVETPSARCVDLGCEYDLRVDAQGDALVEVSLGQVAFELGDRDVYIPSGARCRATKAGGLGTPHFVDCAPALAALVARFDATRDPDARADVAAKLAATASTEQDTLTLWHLLRDGDPRIAASAEARLVELIGHPHADADAWREYLGVFW